MQGLIIIVAGPDPERFRSALEVAGANAALGRPTRLFLQSAAASLLRGTTAATAAAGMPSLQELLEEIMALGAGISVCQSGLALAGLRADELPAGVEAGGLIELLSTRGDHQMVIV